MKKVQFLPALALLGGCAADCERPNLLVIQTDEQTFRSLGCYRQLMSDDQAYPWGRDAVVETPNIDRIGQEGAICTKYYATCPVSTPSRASFQTGLYPVATGAPINDMAMNPNLTTYAEQLRRAGYNTSYVGKWHLGGVPKIGRPYFEPGYSFGYENRTYMYDDGHWKWYDVVREPNHIKAYADSPKAQDKYQYSTDYLTDKALEVLSTEIKEKKPFYMMLSIPDPHSPDVAREPYRSEYLALDYTAPKTMVADDGEDPRPMWGQVGFSVKGKPFNEKAVANYFGSVKCIDDNVGRVLSYLEQMGELDNTIIVFTSDHGDMLYEHSRINKGVPYEAAAKIPFVIRYPKSIKAGKIIDTPYTTADFAPTILGLMGVDQIQGVEGVDASAALISADDKVSEDRVVYLTACPWNEWTMATDGRYKLVLSCLDTPWLFDLEVDPDETKNLYSDPQYKAIADNLQAELIRQMELYNEPALAFNHPFLYSADDKVSYVRKESSDYKFKPNELDPIIMEMEQFSIRPL